MQLQKGARNWTLRHDLPSAVNSETSVDLTLQVAATQKTSLQTKLLFRNTSGALRIVLFLWQSRCRWKFEISEIQSR